MQATIAKWGNSLALRLPRTVADPVHLREGTAVDIRINGETLVVRHVRPKYRLEDLLRGFKPEHRYGEVDWGQATGKEAW